MLRGGGASAGGVAAVGRKFDVLGRVYMAVALVVVVVLVLVLVLVLTASVVVVVVVVVTYVEEGGVEFRSYVLRSMCLFVLWH